MGRFSFFYVEKLDTSAIYKAIVQHFSVNFIIGAIKKYFLPPGASEILVKSILMISIKGGG